MVIWFVKAKTSFPLLRSQGSHKDTFQQCSPPSRAFWAKREGASVPTLGSESPLKIAKIGAHTTNPYFCVALFSVKRSYATATASVSSVAGSSASATSSASAIILVLALRFTLPLGLASASALAFCSACSEALPINIGITVI